MKNFWSKLTAIIPASFALVSALAFVVVAYVYKLTSLVPGVSRAETATIVRPELEPSIIAQPIMLPYYCGIYLIKLLGGENIIWFRLLSVAIALAAILGIYFLLRFWVKESIAYAATLMFALSAFMLHNGRLATSLIVSSLLAVGLWLAVWFAHTKYRSLLLVLAGFTAVVLFYVPGLNILMIAALLWQHKQIRSVMRRIPAYFTAIIFAVCIAAVLPVILATIERPSYAMEFFGIPSQTETLRAFGSTTFSAIKALFYRAYFSHDLWLSPLPLLGAASFILFIIGLYQAIANFTLDRSKFILGLLVAILVFIGLGNAPLFAALMVVVYATIALGLEAMLDMWLSVFPKNPFARKLGVTLLCLVAAVICFQGLVQYFVAWPELSTTKASFQSQHK